MEPDVIIERFQQALAQFCEKDRSLLTRNVSERTMTGRLGIYLERLFSNYDVDCEYNRNMEQPKTIVLNDGTSTNPLPDVIVHRRLSNEHNLLMIEAKSSSSHASQERDRQKIEAFAREPYNYTVGVLLTFQNNLSADGNCFCWEVFYNGHWQEPVYE